MSDPVVDTVEVGATPDAIWAMLDDPDALARILPGCESIVREASDRFVAVIASKVRFMTIRSDVVVTLLEADRPRHVRLQLEGRPRGLGGSFHAAIPFDIEALGPNRSRVAYSVAIDLSGSLAAFGGAGLAEPLRAQIGELIRNAEREVGPGSSGASPETGG
jgi:2-furoyl-CoA dehydrogenase large subunit